MKKLFILLPALFFLTACPSEQEVKEMVGGMADKRNQAIAVISSSDFSLEGLLKTQDYFFDLSEKVHLMKEDKKALESIKYMIKNDGIKKFCEEFIVPIRYWQNLEAFCSSSSPYKCSPDIQNYQSTQAKFLELIGGDLNQKFKNESSCN